MSPTIVDNERTLTGCVIDALVNIPGPLWKVAMLQAGKWGPVVDRFIEISFQRYRNNLCLRCDAHGPKTVIARTNDASNMSAV